MSHEMRLDWLKKLTDERNKLKAELTRERDTFLAEHDENVRLHTALENERERNARLREALEFGLNVMMPEIHSQRTFWPGEVDSFEDRARQALAGDSGAAKQDGGNG